MFRKKASAGIENDHPGRYLRSAWAAIEAVIVTKKNRARLARFFFPTLQNR
ncbi:MAG TPA: hypothetical protein VL402_08980 [Xanthobacteraceae bacterium]|jgi:hypothetical protein|nr:hypothetical protein [Xanthobacteraceae bacterium]